MPKTRPTRGKRKPARCPDCGTVLKAYCEVAKDFSHEEKAVLCSGCRGFLRRQERALSPGQWDFTVTEDPRPVKPKPIEPKVLEGP